MQQDCLGVRVYLLGRFEVKSGDRVIIDQRWPRRKAKALIKQLALNHGGWMHREQLLDSLWPELDPAAADHNFRQNLHYLRQAFEEHGLTAPVVTADRTTIGLAPETWVDVVAFREAHRAARDARTDPTPYEQALDLYAGDLLPEDMYEDWTQPPRDELRALQRQLVFELASLHELRGHSDVSARHLEALVRADPLDEEAHRALIRVYAEAGDRNRAQRQYERCRDALQKELGEEPSEETEAVHRSVQEGAPGASRPVLPNTPFIGRRGEMKRLLDGLDSAFHARGTLFMLAGEAGIGKTRAAEELALHARLRGAQVLWGRCYEGEGASAYWPWVQVLRGYIRDRSSEDVRALSGAGAPHLVNLLPELSDLLPGIAPGPPPESAVRVVGGLLEPLIDVDQARFQLFDSVGTLLSRAAARQPLVLVIDDLHRADAPSLLLLEFLAGVLHDLPMLVLGTYRDTELPPDHPLSGSIAVMERRHPGHTIKFEGFSRLEVAELMRAATGQQPRDSVAGAVCEQTGGNPLLVQELSRVLVAAGLPEQALDSPGWGIALPRGAQSVILHSLYRLSQPCQRVLAAAAVAGREFEFSLLARLELPESDLHEAVEEAISAQVIARVPGDPGRLAFRHTLLREALYGHLPVMHRARMHARVGEALEVLYGPDTDQHASELAHHFLEAAPAGTSATAVQYARRAAARAEELFAYEEAAGMYQRALNLAGIGSAVDDGLRCELLLSLGQAKWDAGDPAAGRKAFLNAAAVARQRGDYARLARAALGCGRSLTSLGTVDETVVGLLEESLAGLSADETPLRAMVMASLARALYWSPDAGRRRSLSRDAVDQARRAGDDLVLAHVLDAAWIALWFPDNPEERLAMATELLELAQAAGDRARAHQGHRWRMIALLELGRTTEAREESEAQARLARELRHSAQLENASVIAAMWALFEGRFDDAEHLASEALASARRASDRAAVEQFGAQVIALFRERARLPEIEPMVRIFTERNPGVPAWRAVLAWIYALQGKEPEARAEFERLAVGGFACLNRNFMWLMTMSLLADVCSFLRDKRNAAVLCEQLLPFAGRNIVMGYAIVCAGSVSRCLGVLAATIADYSAAEGHFVSAIDLNDRIGARPWAAWTRFEYARMLALRASRGDRKRSFSLLESALTSARDLQMPALEQQIAALNAGESQ